MKMRKSTWLLLVLALAAIFLVAGCAPNTPPTNGEEPNGEEPPVTPPADKNCPKVVSTIIGNAYNPVWLDVDGDGRGDIRIPYVTKLTVTFNESVTSGCIEDPMNWDITVKNSDRNDTELTENENLVLVLEADLSTDGKKVDVYALVWEPLSYVVKDVVYRVGNGPSQLARDLVATVGENFIGLICSEDDADDYATPGDDAIIEQALHMDPDNVEILDYTLVSGPKTPKYADKVEWKLKNCVVADELGNACCDYSDSACCLEPTCAECEEGCILGSEGSCQ